MGTAQNIAQRFAKNEDTDLVRDIALIIDQEEEQEKFYQIFQEKILNELSFLTTSVWDYTFTVIQKFIISKSCSDQQNIDLKIFKSFELMSTSAAEMTNVRFSYQLHSAYSQNRTLSAVYINQQNLSIVKSIMIDFVKDEIVTAEALFFYDENEMNDLTILSLTNNISSFQNTETVVNAIVFESAFIIIN